MKNIRVLSEIFQFLEVNFSIYLNRRVFLMNRGTTLEGSLETLPCVLGGGGGWERRFRHFF